MPLNFLYLPRFNHLQKSIALFLLLAISYFIYSFGLTGIFLADDYANLTELENIQLYDWQSIGRYLFDGGSGPLKRPVSLFSFALQAPAWPLSPIDFKTVNLLIHLLSAGFIFWLSLSLAPLFFPRLSNKQQTAFAFLTTLLWVLHPLNVSTVLYVVQRMTELTALFVILSLFLYTRGRYAFEAKRIKTGYFLVSFSLIVTGSLAVLSKENGVLLILYLLILEYTAFRHMTKPVNWRIWQTIFLYLPALAIIGYLLLILSTSANHYTHRDFTMVQRLFTETRIVSEYLQQIIIPNPLKLGLIHDTFSLSYGLFQPITTVIAIVFLSLLAGFAVVKRKKYPAVTFAIGFFFAGHLLESTFISLELYFEHRNYLPMLGILFLLAFGLIWLFEKVKTYRLRFVIYMGLILYVLSFPYQTWIQTQLWGNPIKQALTWAERHPDSYFAQTYSAVILNDYQQYKQAKQRHQYILQHFPKAHEGHLFIQSLNCRQPDLQQVGENNLQALLADLTPPIDLNLDLLNGLNLVIDEYARDCALNVSDLYTLFETILTAGVDSPYLAFYYQAYARLYAVDENMSKSLDYLSRALDLHDNARLHLQKIHLLMSASQFKVALQEIKIMRQKSKGFEKTLYDDELKSTQLLLEELIELQKKYPPKPQDSYANQTTLPQHRATVLE